MPSLKLPKELSLPSGRRVRLDVRLAEREAARVAELDELSAALELLATPRLVECAGRSVSLDELELRDFHVLRAVLARSRLLPELERACICENCGERCRLRPSSLLELGPFVHGELDDPELDAPFDHARSHPIPPVFTSSGLARSVRLAPRSASDLRPLVRAGARPLELGPSVVVALGVVRLGRERRADRIARSLARAGDEVWTALGELYDQAHYAARLEVAARCERCGARIALRAPGGHELDRVAPVEVRSDDDEARAAPMVLEEFERRAARYAARSFRRLGVAPISVVVDAGVPLCDDGGEPLLGCYTPHASDASGALEQPAEIRLFYRSFCAEARLDPSFDLDGEIRETIEHELEHHDNHLRGEDPLDDEERDEIARELVRRVGRQELLLRGLGGLVSDLAGFLRVTWPILLVVAALVLYPTCSGSR